MARKPSGCRVRASRCDVCNLSVSQVWPMHASPYSHLSCARAHANGSRGAPRQTSARLHRREWHGGPGRRSTRRVIRTTGNRVETERAGSRAQHNVFQERNGMRMQAHSPLSYLRHLGRLSTCAVSAGPLPNPNSKLQTLSPSP